MTNAVSWKWSLCSLTASWLLSRSQKHNPTFTRILFFFPGGIKLWGLCSQSVTTLLDWGSSVAAAAIRTEQAFLLPPATRALSGGAFHFLKMHQKQREGRREETKAAGDPAPWKTEEKDYQKQENGSGIYSSRLKQSDDGDSWQQPAHLCWGVGHRGRREGWLGWLETTKNERPTNLTFNI